MPNGVDKRKLKKPCVVKKVKMARKAKKKKAKK